MRKLNTHSREKFGYLEIRHRGKLLTTTVGARSYENYFCGRANQTKRNYTLGRIPYGYEHRPELIANLFIQSAAQWWMVMERNNIFDVFEQMDVGDQIRIPRGS